MFEETYRTWEGGGIVWAYLGPPEAASPLPEYELVRAPQTHRYRIEPNRKTLETLVTYGCTSGLLSRKPAVEKLFDPSARALKDSVAK